MVNRLCRYGPLLALLLSLASPAARAQAPQRERIALHPCVITGGSAKTPVEELENACAVSAARESVDFIPSTEVTNFLKDEACAKAKDRAACLAQLNAPAKTPHGRAKTLSCANSKNRDACLGRLAAATKADHTLYITIDVKDVPAVKKGKTKGPTTRVTRITGIVVDPKGKKVEERSQDASPNDAPNDAIRFGVAYILDRLEVTKPPPPEITPLPLGPTAENTPPPSGPTYSPTPTPPEPTAKPGASSAPPLASSKQEPPHERTWKTKAGIASAVAGGAGVVAAIILGTSGNSKAKEFNDAFASGLPPSTELPRLDQLRDDAKSQQKTATIAGVAGGALIITGGVLWFIDRPSGGGSSSPGKAGTATLLVGPRQVGVSVLLP
jgi:hypothetical protein